MNWFCNKGYLVIESFASEDEIGALRKRMNELLTQSDCSVSSIFSTKNQVLSLSFFSSSIQIHHMINSLKPFYLNLILLCLFCRRRLPIITSLRALKKSPSSLKVCFLSTLSSFPFIYFVSYNQNHPLGFSFVMVFLGILCFLYVWRNICCTNLRYISLQNLKNTILLFKTLEWMNVNIKLSWKDRHFFSFDTVWMQFFSL